MGDHLLMTAYIDTHCHLYQPEFDADRAGLLARATAAGVRTMLCIGVDVATSRASLALATEHANIFAAIGMQPNYVAGSQPGDFEILAELARRPRVAAIGETGLDRYWNDTPIEQQRESFTRHIALARELNLPFIVHMRDCEADIVELLAGEYAQHGPLNGVMHSFSGGEATARECLKFGLHISFAGMVTYKKSDELRAVAKLVPDDRILIETDSPYLSPMPFRGKRNEPARVVHTAEHLAEVRGVPLSQFAAQTTANAERLFKFESLR